MDNKDFERKWQAEGYGDFAVATLPAGRATTAHTHPFDVAAIVLDGEITLSCFGQDRRYRAGDVFTMARGTEHCETIGAAGVEYLACRRQS